ncbi:hypothetical protein FAGAP_2936 [Fusarium agapanthi]|uniref:Chromo domain-containing protein n=1 Tax=Fusarium agapanthi TaxID=1803897 RepID=A0A9P5BI36_9HYPO|nr:hypothetical protein FAGAP_2936 [Fusarium agapanthi]
MSFYRTTTKSSATTGSHSWSEDVAGKSISDSQPTARTELLTYFRLSSIGEEVHSLKAIRITSHILARRIHTVWFTVEWNDGEESWEPEYALQRLQPEVVYTYWDAKEGGRKGATKFDLFHDFAILDHGGMINHSGKRAREHCYKIQWVGYDEKDHSWEPAAKVAILVPRMKEEYDQMHGLRDLHTVGACNVGYHVDFLVKLSSDVGEVRYIMSTERLVP